MSCIVSNSPPNSQQKQRPMINSSHYEAKCKYYFEKMDGIPANMLQHLKEDCSKISKEIRDTLHIMFKAYKKVGMELGTDKWIGFVSDSGSDMAKAQRLMHQAESRRNDNSIINAIESINFWEKLTMFYELLRPYGHIIMILESEYATLGQVVATWAWLREVINKLPSNEREFKTLMINEIDNQWKKIYNPIFLITWFLHPYHQGKGIKLTKLLQIQENAYSLFCILYPDKDNNAFIDKWLDYQNKEAEFAYRPFSIPPSSTTSERVWSLMGNIHTERRNHLSSKKAVKMAQIIWYIREQFFANKSKKAQDSLDSLK
ncbi:13170_t:CDS:2, partial [Funneliformis mosseae]